MLPFVGEKGKFQQRAGSTDDDLDDDSANDGRAGMNYGPYRSHKQAATAIRKAKERDEGHALAELSESVNIPV